MYEAKPEIRYRLGGYYISYEELRQIVEHDLSTHEVILRIVKDYVDDLIERVFGLNVDELKSKDPSTYYAIIMELVRSEFINVVQYIRSKIYRSRSKQ
ncbi:MAG: hypothetical protein J7L82_02310 [Staphylothermus sp.]|nr:hypothetical protein [Staphylothermus sp.]